MVFSSIIFVFYFLPAVLFLYYTVGFRNTRIKNFILLAASLFFYAWGEPKNIWLLLLSCVGNWLAGMGIGCCKESTNKKKYILITACIFNIGILFWFKYLNFTVSSINGLLGIQAIDVKYIALPIGISFYTFQALSYVIDVYKGEAQVQRNPLYLTLYISLFPQLVAGPIVKYRHVEGQLKNRRENFEKFSDGICRFTVGLGKKLLLANSFAIVADNIYSLTRATHTQIAIPAALAWLGSFAYTLQIFFDFSAYSDMAIGLGKMFGFEFQENFNYPYISKSIGEFWRRWHISLSGWFREYVYFPLGGSRVNNNDIMVRNLFIVWLLTGIWHGADWTFLLWGMWNFILILFERLVLFDKIKGFDGWKHVYTMTAVNFGWVLFRSENLTQFTEYIKNMFCLNGNGFFSAAAWMFIREYGIFFAAGIILCIPRNQEKLAVEGKIGIAVRQVGYPAGMAAVFILCMIYMVKSGYNPFIYFNF